MHSTRVVAVLTLVVGLAHCFSWDIVVGGDKQLNFYYNGTLTHTEEIALATQITSVTYEPVHYRVLFTDVNYPSMIMSSFDLATRKIQSLFTTTSNDYYMRVVYDPVTQLLVWKTWYNIYTFSLNPAPSDKAVDGNLLVTMHNLCRDIAVDSCGGCKTGYSGERCEVNACHDYCLHGGVCSLNEENKRVCQCTAGYDGERCDISICNEYCMQGNCSVGADGLPKCSCTTGYSGERCEENACHKHCLNGGVCSLNEEDEPACQCTAGYGGRRCEVFADKEISCDADNSGEATVSACRRFCLNNGVCSLNEASEPVCQCTADYDGQRCDVPAFVVKWFLYAYKNVPPVALSEAVKSTRASTVV